MAWSTRELAELAGTTVNTIRHYHRLGLLEEPERRHNGYKRYGTQELVRLLRIRRLVALGVPLARISEVGADGVVAPEALRQVDAGLAADIERLVRARTDIAAILGDSGTTATPPGFESVASGLSLILIYHQLYDGKSMTDLRQVAQAGTDPVSADLHALPPAADEATRRKLAERLAPILVRHLVDHPWLRDPAGHLSTSKDVTQQTFLDAVAGLYNTAQLEVLGRAGVLAREHLRRARASSTEKTSARRVRSATAGMPCDANVRTRTADAAPKWSPAPSPRSRYRSSAA